MARDASPTRVRRVCSLGQRAWRRLPTLDAMVIDFRADAGQAGQLIPGAYERNTLTHRQPGSMDASGSVAVPVGSSSMDATTTAEREREGGGAPNQRHRTVQAQSRSGPALRAAVGNGSWLTGGYLWFRTLRLARR